MKGGRTVAFYLMGEEEWIWNNSAEEIEEEENLDEWIL